MTLAHLLSATTARIALLPAAVAAACGHSNEPPMQPAANPLLAARPLEAINGALCDFAQRCGKFGVPGDRGPTTEIEYSDRQDCMTAARVDTKQAFGSCEDDLDSADVDECLDAINAQDCRDWTSQVAHLKECSEDDLCRVSASTERRSRLMSVAATKSNNHSL